MCVLYTCEHVDIFGQPLIKHVYSNIQQCSEAFFVQNSKVVTGDPCPQVNTIIILFNLLTICPYGILFFSVHLGICSSGFIYNI